MANTSGTAEGCGAFPSWEPCRHDSPAACTPGQVDTLNAFRSTFLDRLAKGPALNPSATGGSGLFVDSCYGHCAEAGNHWNPSALGFQQLQGDKSPFSADCSRGTGLGEGWATMQVDGFTPSQAVGAWFFERTNGKANIYIDCKLTGPSTCNPTCRK